MDNDSSHDSNRHAGRPLSGEETTNVGSSSRIKLMLCTTELAVGGAEQALVELALGLDRQRFDIQVVSLKPCPSAPRDRLVRRLREGGIEPHFLGAKLKLSGPRTLWRLRQFLRRQRPDVLQTFLFHANVLGPMAARMVGVPCVVTGLRVAERTRRWRAWVEARAARGAARHVCVSQAVADFAREKLGLREERLLVIPNGVDAQRFAAARSADLQQLGVLPGRRMIVCVGRLDWQKGLDRLMEVAPGLLEQLPEHDLMLVGNGPEHALIESVARRKNIAPRVHLVGWQDDVPGILAASELLVLPSRWEGMPNVVLEAMASGLPVVAMRVEGVEEILGPGAEQQIVPQGDSQAFLDRVVSILSDEEKAGLLGEANVARVVDSFSWTNTVGQYAALYESLAGNLDT